MIVNDYVQLFERKKERKLVNIIYHLKKLFLSFFLIVTLHISDSPYNYNDTIYVHLYIDLSPKWIQNLADSMNISTSIYNSQMHYFQSIDLHNFFDYILCFFFLKDYRRRFANFIDPTYQLMLDHQQNIPKKNY